MIDVNAYAEFWRSVVDRIADGIRNEGGDPTDLTLRNQVVTDVAHALMQCYGLAGGELGDLLAEMDAVDLSPDLAEYLLRVGLTSWAERDTALDDAKRQPIIERYDVDGPNGMFPVRSACY
jgi:hypothetical protein